MPSELDMPTLANDYGDMNLPGANPKTLKEWLDERRDELEMTLGDVADAAGLSEEGIRKVVTGQRSPRSSTRRKIERAVRWAAGSIDAIERGETPVKLEDAQPAPATPQSTQEERDMAILEQALDAVGLDAALTLILKRVQERNEHRP